MGLPIVETGDKWHVNVGQKIPLNRDRNNVKPTFLRTVRTLGPERDERSSGRRRRQRGLGATGQFRSGLLRQGDQARSGPAVRREASGLRPERPEANKTWVSQGGTLVYGSMMNGQEWKNAKEAGAIIPAGQLCPTAKPYSDDPNAPPANVIPEENGPRA